MSMGFEPTNEQLAIIQHPDEPLRVAAGAGTGKTTGVIENVKHLLTTGPEFLPENVRMIQILDACDFKLLRDPQDRVVSGQKVIGEVQ